MRPIDSALFLNDHCFVQGGASRIAIDEAVTLAESGVNSTTCTQNSLHCPAGVGGATNFAHNLQLLIVDNTTHATVYSGLLDGITSTITVCGIGAGCPQWAANETHNLTVTVTFPVHGSATDNTYQGTGAAATFTWSRS